MDINPRWREKACPFTPFFSARRIQRLSARLVTRVAGSLVLVTMSIFLPFLLTKTPLLPREEQSRCERIWSLAQNQLQLNDPLRNLVPAASDFRQDDFKE
jgi:hypothetical protein